MKPFLRSIVKSSICFTGAILLISIGAVCYAQSFQFKNYSVEDGLSGLEVSAICQDDYGNIWLGSNGGGVSVFNGIRFFSYTKDQGLSGNHINDIIKDGNGDLWFCTNKGLSILDKMEMKFGAKEELSFINYNAEDGLPDNIVWAAFQDKQGVVWLGTNDGLSRVDNAKNNDEPLRFINSKMGLSHQVVTTIIQDSDGMLWIGTKNGLTTFKEEAPEGKQYEYYSTKDGLPHDSISSLLEDKQGRIWVGTEKGFAQFIPEEKRSTANSFIGYTRIKGTQLSRINTISEDHNGSVWFGCWSGQGVVQYEPERNRFFRYTSKNGLVGDNVMSILEDTEHNLWFGTYGMGVSKLTNRKFEIYSKIDGLPDNIIWAITEDINSNMWIGNNFGGVSRLVRKGEIWSGTNNYEIQNYSIENGFTGDRVNSIAEDKSGNLWFCSEEGLSKLSMPLPVFTKNPKSVIKLNFKNYTIRNGLIKRRVNIFFEDSWGRKWISYTGGKVSTIQERRSGIISENIDHPILNTYDTYCIHEDVNKNLWFATEGGVVSIKTDEETGRITDYIELKEKDGLINSDVRAIAEDKEGNLWFGTGGGIMKYNISTPGKEILSFTSKDGLSSDRITLLVFDDNENLWIGTKEGIDKFSTKKYYKIIKRFDEMENQLVANKLEKFKHYGFLEGFVGSETNINAVCKDREGNLWFGTRRGAMKYIPSEDKVNKIPPTIHITNVHVFSDEVPISDEVILNNNQNYLTFSFIGISHTLPKKVAYKYKLVGFDKEWVFNSFSNQASYENLAPGNYEFLVKSTNADGVWNEEPARIQVEIMPPFWRTNWFYLCVMALLIGLVYLIIKLRLRNLRRMTALLEVEVERKTKELRSSEQQYRTLFEKISDSIFIFQKDGHHFLDCNETAVDNYGYSKEEIRSMTPFDLHPENELEKVAKQIDQPTAGTPNYYTHITKTGKEVQVEIASDDLEYMGKNAMISIVRDVTERRRAEEDIKKMNKELTSSIRYTKRILDSVLQSKENFKNIFKDSFVLYKPRGIVSGDFYWFCELEDKVIIAVMDCTGHGLAGAFLSMVGNGLLNTIVLDNKITDPASILKELHEGIVSALNKEEKDSFTLDGMDMGICVVDRKNKILEASSASRPVVLVRNNQYEVIRGRKKLPIGLALGDKREYKTEKTPFKKGDTIYMLTDGYCDQFGGKDNEKFMAERFLNLLVSMQGLSMADQGVELDNVIEEWKGKRKQLDDILVVGFRL